MNFFTVVKLWLVSAVLITAIQLIVIYEVGGLMRYINALQVVMNIVLTIRLVRVLRDA